MVVMPNGSEFAGFNNANEIANFVITIISHPDFPILPLSTGSYGFPDESIGTPAYNYRHAIIGPIELPHPLESHLRFT